MMNVQIYRNGVEFTNEVISISSEQNICNSIGTIQVAVHGRTTTPFSPGDELVLWLNGTKVGTYYCFKTNREVDILTLIGQNESYKLSNYFVTDTYKIDYPTMTRYWIEKFLTEAGITYSFTTSDMGTLIQNDTTLGLGMVDSIITPLLQQSGWYLFFDEDNNVVIGSLEKNPDNSVGTISEILTIQTQEDDNMLRNRGIVWGKANPHTGQWVFSYRDMKTGYETWDGDIRPVVLSAGNIINSGDASVVASQLVNEFSSITFVITVEIPGTAQYKLGDTVLLDSEYITKYCLVTNVQQSVSSSGFITTLTLEQRCPRIIAFFSSTYVYVGTQGKGVWRKSFSYPDTWRDFSNGIPEEDKIITDLKITDGVFACVANTKLYYRTSSSAWTKYNPVSFIDDALEVHTTFTCSGCVINKKNGNIIAVYSDMSTNKSWIVEITASGSVVSKKYILTSNSEQIRAFDVDMFAGKPVITGTIPGDMSNYYNYLGPDKRNDTMVSNWGQYSTINDQSGYNTIFTGVGATYRGNSLFYRNGTTHVLYLFKNCLGSSYDLYSYFYGTVTLSLPMPINDSEVIAYSIYPPKDIYKINIETGVSTAINTISRNTNPVIQFAYLTKDDLIYFIISSHIGTYPNITYYVEYITYNVASGSFSGYTTIESATPPTPIHDYSTKSVWWSTEFSSNSIFNLGTFPTFLRIDSSSSFSTKHFSDITDYNPATGYPYDYDTPFKDTTQIAPDYKNNVLYRLSHYIPTDYYRLSKITSNLNVTTVYEGITGYRLIWSRVSVYAYDPNTYMLYSVPEMSLVWDLGEPLNIAYIVDDRKNALVVSKGGYLYWYYLSSKLVEKINNVSTSDNIIDLNGQLFTDNGGNNYNFPLAQLPIGGGQYVTTIKDGDTYSVIDTTPGPTILENSQDSPIVTYPLNWNDYRMSGLALSGMSGLAPISSLVTNFRVSFYPTSGAFYSPTSGISFTDIQYSGAAITYIDDLRVFYTSPPNLVDSTTISGISNNEWLAITQSGLIKNNYVTFSGGWGIVSGVPNTINHIETGNYEIAYFGSTSGIAPQFYEKSYFSNYDWQESTSGLPSGYPINIIRVDDRI